MIYIATGLILCFHPANERRHYKVTPYIIGWVQTRTQPCVTISLWMYSNLTVPVIELFDLFYLYPFQRNYQKDFHDIYER